jgi:hypothetical protein
MYLQLGLALALLSGIAFAQDESISSAASSAISSVASALPSSIITEAVSQGASSAISSSSSSAISSLASALPSSIISGASSAISSVASALTSLTTITDSYIGSTPTGSNTAGPSPSESIIAANTAHSNSGIKIGIAVAVPVGVVLIALILAVFLIRRRRRRRRKLRQNNESQPYDGQEEVQEGQGHPETYYKKPELEAEPVIDPTIRGPVKSKFELRSQGTVKGKTVGNPGAIDAVEAPNTNRPWSQERRGSIPTELHPNPISEAGTGTLTEPEMKQLKQQAGASKTSTSTSTVVASSSDQSFLQPFQTISAEVSELAEEADMIVQELGLVNLRKKALTTQASAMGQRPEDVEGRKGEEFKELLERDARLKGRLDEIERERLGQSRLA